MKRIGAGAILLAIAGWWLAEACAPDFRRAVFSYVRHPDLPRTEFLAGRLGVLQPTFARSYLVIAYRYLNGTGMSAEEREQARDYYKDRSRGSWDGLGNDWTDRWREVRSRIQNPRAPAARLITQGQLAYDPETHSFAMNCAEDAFRVAVHTLEVRRRQFGGASEAFRSWLAAQDMVFENCLGGAARIPSEASAGLPPLVHADRDYQIAAAYFYAGDYAAALDRFRRIGSDAASPWNAISRYLVVRTLLRMTDGTTATSQSRSQLNTEASAILADPKLTPVHSMTWNLVERAGIRQRDQRYFRELALLLSSPGQGNGFREALWNYTDLFDQMIGEADPNELYPPATPVTADLSRFRDADLSDWLFSFQSRDSSILTHCVERWRMTHSVAWLLAALGHAPGDSAESLGLLDAAGRIPETSPADLTARFHMLRIYQELGDRRAARDGVSHLLAGPLCRNLPSSTNLFRGLAMLSAPDLSEFIRFATRRPVLITWQVNTGESPAFSGDRGTRPASPDAERFDSDATRILNRQTPFRLLEEISLREQLPAELHREALLTAFVRGLMLEQDLTGIPRELGTAAPELAGYITAYLGETSDEGRRFAAAFLLLHRPEARPYFAAGITRQSRPGRLDPYRDNWWCPLDIELELDSRANHDWWYRGTPNLLQRPAFSTTPAFLTAGISEEAQRELDRLGKLGAATDFLGSAVLPYAAAHPNDPRIPEALYWLVRAGHYGCVDTDTWQTTRAAFRLLQRRYAATTWAKRTPTWFKNDYDIRTEIKDRRPGN